MKKIKTSGFFYILFFPFCLFAESGALDGSIALFSNYEQRGALETDDAIEAIFNGCKGENITSSCSIQDLITARVRQLSAEIKKNKKNLTSVQELQEMAAVLKRLSRHIRKNRVVYDFLGYARILDRRYKHAFNNEYLVEDVYRLPELYDYSPKGGDSLMKFFQLLQSDLGKISRFESKLHSRYGRLKSRNYVFKMECIKVRNEILFHPWYRYRLHHGSEFFADALSPIVYMGKVIFHVVPSIFCILGLTASTALGGSGPNQD